MADSPTRRSLEYLRRLGFQAAVTEKWNPHAKIRQDLFGVIDILACDLETTLGVQTTTKAHMKDRIRKIQESGILSWWLTARRQLHVHGWEKKNGRWNVVVYEFQ